MKKILPAIVLALSFSAQAKVLDKVAGVINDRVFTLSEITHVQKTLSVRKEIIPFIYKKNKYTKQEILKILQNNFIIRDKLAEQGYVISDDRVEQSIQDTVNRIKQQRQDPTFNKDKLLSFLSSKSNISYNEYFELTRTAIEYSTFVRSIIAPLVTVTDQEIKNFYYNNTKNKKTLSFQYDLLSFSLSAKGLSKKDLNSLPEILQTYRKTGNIPAKYKNFTTSDIGEILGEELPAKLNALLKITDENSFSKPYRTGEDVQFFFLKKKDLVNSKDFNQKKGQIREQIFSKRSDGLIQNWLSRKALDYYILENI